MNSVQKRRWPIRRMAAAAVVGLGASLIEVGSASAEPLITVNVDNVLKGRAGDRVLVESATVPAEFVGQTCLIKAESLNQESVHPNNNLIIVAGDQTFTVDDVESEANQFREVEEFEEIAPEIQVFVELGPDGVSSGGFVITVDCTVEPPTPTTIAPTTTQAPTTQAPTTQAPTTTAPTTTGDLDPEGGGEIIDPITTTTPDPAGPEVTQPTTPDPAGPTLPVTGSTVGIFVFSGLWLLGAGVFLQRAAATRLTR